MAGWRSPRSLIVACLRLGVAFTSPHPAIAWGDEGHKVIALIADHYIGPVGSGGARGRLKRK
jgi:hypothetical protein